MNLKRNCQSGFTQVELMVALVIVIVLSVMAFGIVRSAQDKAKQIDCANNMRQIGIAMQVYADENGHYPETAHTTSLDRAWIYELEKYLDEFDEVRICPADPKARDRLENKGTSYVLNSFVFVQKFDLFGNTVGRSVNRPAALPYPSRTILAFCCSDDVPSGPGNDHTHSERWNSWAALTRDIAPDRHGGKRSNYLFADGRVVVWTEEEVKTMLESGRNIAEPPGL
ncbi:MAG: type II secretion system protein [Verrucomicrobiota bacterium]